MSRLSRSFWLLLAGVFFSANVGAAVGGFESSRYIGLDEIKPGMKAQCLTVFSGTEPEKFDFEVVSVVRNIGPGRDAILVKGLDERFIHAGIVAGCSGSPVYIDGRLAGAVSFGWSFSKDALYGVTPIEEMLAVGSGGQGAGGTQMSIGLSGAIDLAQVEQQIVSNLRQWSQTDTAEGLLPMPLAVSGIPAGAGEELARFLGAGGFAVEAVPGGSASSGSQHTKLEAGSCLAIPLVSGDIQLTVVGTATEVKNGRVLGFGHQLLGYGAVDLPMATGEIHTVVANTMRSFKIGSPIDIVGTLTTDESRAVSGTIGRAPDMIPMTIEVSRYNDPQKRSYRCEVANNRMLTGLLVRVSLYGAMMQRGALPPDNTIKYKADIDVEGGETISYENVLSNENVAELLTEAMVPVTLVMNNQFESRQVKSMRFEVEELDKVQVGVIRSVDLSDQKVEQGGKLSVGAVVEAMRGPTQRYTLDFNVPADLKPGQYEILVTGGTGYLEFLKRAALQRFIAEDFDSLVEALNNVLQIRRDRLYCIFVLPRGGIALERAELADLPATKSMVLADASRTVEVRPYQHWMERSAATGRVIDGQEQIQVEVTGRF
jgi:hypothetical protein